MGTELVTFKIEQDFLEKLDKTSKSAGYQNRTEFIRAALRDKIDEVKLKKAMQELIHLKGVAKKKTTDEEREQIREKVFKELDKKFR